jgi:predicted lipoprotein with Yx(FWY)xxD motif
VTQSAEQGRVTVERAGLGRLGTVLVTNKGFARYIFAPDAAHDVTGRVVTYHGWPLYTCLGDASPGHAAGQGKDDDGYWYVMRPSGQIVGN